MLHDIVFFFFSSRRRHTRCSRDWSSDVCSSDLTLIGIAVGIPCAVATARLIAHLLFKVTPYDPVTLALVPLVLIAVGSLASYIPARRAMTVDPLVALRYQ